MNGKPPPLIAAVRELEVATPIPVNWGPIIEKVRKQLKKMEKKEAEAENVREHERDEE